MGQTFPSVSVVQQRTEPDSNKKSDKPYVQDQVPQHTVGRLAHSFVHFLKGFIQKYLKC